MAHTYQIRSADREIHMLSTRPRAATQTTNQILLKALFPTY